MSSKPLVTIAAVSLLGIVLMLSISGCAVGPNFKKPQAKLQDNWNEKNDPRVATQTAVSSQWWKVFNDPALDQLIQFAYKQNLPLQIAGLRILEARAQLGIATGQQYPQQQEAFGDVSRFGLSNNAPNGAGLDRNFWNYQFGFDAAWEMDFWGKFRRGVESAQASFIGSMADYDNALVSLTSEVARTYTVIRTFEVLIDLANQNADVQKEGLQIAESRFRNGATTELDVAQARTLLESTLATIPQLQTARQQSLNALCTLLGQPTGTIQSIMDANSVIPIAPAEVAVSVPAELLRRRPDIRSAELAAAAQCARIGIAKADLYPSFSLFGQIGVQTSSQGGFRSNNANFHNLFDGDSFFFSYGPGFQWPLFNYGRIENNIRVQDARFQELLVNYQNTVLQAAQEVEDSLIGFLKAQESTAFDQNSVNAAKRSVQIALVQYREGATDYERVLDTQRVLLQEQNNLTQARSSIATNLIALYKALGGGWELRQGQSFITEDAQAEMKKRTDWGHLLPQAPAPQTLNPPPPAEKLPLFPKTD